MTSDRMAFWTVMTPPGLMPSFEGTSGCRMAEDGNGARRASRARTSSRLEGEIERHDLGERGGEARLVGLLSNSTSPGIGVPDIGGVFRVRQRRLDPERGGDEQRQHWGR